MKIGFIAGAFDLLHAGHVHTLGGTRSKCDYLIVGLHVDPSRERRDKNKPVQTVFERFIQLQSCKYVDAIIPYETEMDLLNLMRMEKIDVRFLGTDYQDEEAIITGKEFIPIEYIDRFHEYSTTELRKRLKK